MIINQKGMRNVSLSQEMSYHIDFKAKGVKNLIITLAFLEVKLLLLVDYLNWHCFVVPGAPPTY